MFKPVKWDIFFENKFAPQNKPNTAKLNFSGVLMHFWGNWQKINIYSKKKELSQKVAKNYYESWVFYMISKRDKFHGIGFDLMETILFGKTCETGQILMKTVFLL